MNSAERSEATLGCISLSRVGQFQLTALLIIVDTNKISNYCADYQSASDIDFSFQTANHKGGQTMPEARRAPSERRSGQDRRKIFTLHRFFYKGPERRIMQDRRSHEERRDGWVRISKWSSVNLQDLKIARYVH